MTLYPLHGRIENVGERFGRLPCLSSGWGLVSCACFLLNAFVVAKAMSVMRGAQGFEGFVMMLVLVYVPPVLLGIGVLLGVAGCSRQRQISAVMGVALNVLGGVGYLAWVGMGRA